MENKKIPTIVIPTHEFNLCMKTKKDKKFEIIDDKGQQKFASIIKVVHSKLGMTTVYFKEH